jgi:hypothetical protein
MRYTESPFGGPPVVSNCANPACGVPLRYLRDGRLFQFEIRPQAAQDQVARLSKGPRTVSHFWLCGECSAKLTLVFDQLQAVVLKPTAA